MSDNSIMKALAPCGLNCEKCFAHVDGDIRKYSIKLRQVLGNFEPYAKRFETMVADPVFKNYPGFKEMLDYFASENCSGCRNEQCKLFTGCGVRQCHQEKGIDFCYECQDFPCDRTHFDKDLYDRWVILNNKIRATSVEAFYEKTKARPRYI